VIFIRPGILKDIRATVVSKKSEVSALWILHESEARLTTHKVDK
jgi:hypothetical protein